MSKIKSIIAVFLIAITLSSCTDKSKLLTKTWKVEDIKLSKPVPPQAQGYFQAMLQQMKDNLRLTYKADKTFEATFGEKTSKGKWEMAKDGKSLKSTDDTGKEITYIIVELTDNKFVYAAAEKGDTATFYLAPSNGAPVKNTNPAAMPPAQSNAPEAAMDTASKK